VAYPQSQEIFLWDDRRKLLGHIVATQGVKIDLEEGRRNKYYLPT
jgi:hypothetical protein